MFKNYFKTAWRNLLRGRSFSVINIAGLGVGMAIAMLILLWAQNELSYDRFHKNAPHIIKLENMVATGANRQLWNVTVAPIGYLAKNNLPGVNDFVRISDNGFRGVYKYGEKTFEEQQTFFTDPSFFSVFDFHLIEGNQSNPFPDRNSMVITESTAKKYFGNDEALGKMITVNDTVHLKVTGVIKDIPANSSIHGDMFFPLSLLAQKLYAGKDGKSLENDFNMFNYHTYLLLKPGFSYDGFAKKLRGLHMAANRNDTEIDYVWIPLQKMHLYNADGSDGGNGTVRMFITIAILILVIACINYVNIATARATIRAKEVSVRKIIGAGRWQLVLQFIVETLSLFIFAVVFALALAYFAIPLFNDISGKELSLHFSNYRVWEIILLTVMGTLVLSGIYPALLLSSFEPVKALRGKITAGISTALFRRILVVTQFTFSIALIICTIIIGQQLHYMRTKELGYDKENVLSFAMNNMSRHFDAVHNDLLKNPGITSVTWSSWDLINNQQQTGNISWEGKQDGETMMISPWGIGKNFISFFKIQFTEGSGFTGSVSDSTHFILNETAIKTAHIKNPIGKKFKLWNTEGTIIGVVKDFHFTSMHEKIKPAVFYYLPHSSGRLYIKTIGKDVPKAIAAAEDEWKKYNPRFPFDYTFLDDAYDKLYRSEERTGMLFNTFSIFAILISCLGLLGLAAYTAQVRTKEIGVRKVLGASVAGIVRLLTRDFLKLVLIANIIAAPVAWYAIQRWLQDFAYRINIQWWVFVLAAFAACLIALLTISFQAIKAAMANPVNSLRTE